MSELWQDARFALRTLRKGWGITAVAVLSLAVAIGGNAAVFSLVSQVLFTPSSVVEPERVALVQERQADQSLNLSSFTSSLATWSDLRERVRSAEDWAAVRIGSMALRGPERAEPVPAAEVTVGFFDLVGVAPRTGRAFRAEEGVEGAARVVVVRPEFWERQGGGEADPLGETLVLDGEPHEIVGVLPPEFSFLFTAADVWVPLTDSPYEAPRDRRDVMTLARLAPGADMARLEAELTALVPRLEEENPRTFEGWTLDVFNLRDDVPTAQTKIFYGLLQGTVFFVLLIACVNITNLLLARGQDRRREIALRSVLGAGRGRIVRQLLTESAMLVVAGLVLGLALGWYGIRLMAGRLATIAPTFEPALDGQVLLFTLGVSALAGLFFGVAPALQTFRQSHAEVLKEGSKGTQGRSRKLLSRTLVVAEIALSLVALGGGGMLVRSFLELRGGDPGFDPAPILTASVSMPESLLSGEEGQRALMERVLERVRGIPGAESTALVSTLPGSFSAPTDTFRVAGGPADPSSEAPQAYSIVATPGYLETFGIDLLRGRFFQEADRDGSPPVVVVNRSFAERWFPGESPVGARLELRGESREVVGVVEDVLQVLFQTPGAPESEAVYLPMAQHPRRAYRVAVRAGERPGRLTEALRTGLIELDRDLVVSRVLTMEEVAERNFAGIDIFNVILGTFGVLALLLASVGTYGVLSYSVGQRTREIGIRMAMGARGRALIRMVAGQGVAMALLGLLLGGLALVPVVRLLRVLMEGFASVHPETGWMVAGVLFLVTLAASLVPAWRAAELDPVEALQDG